MHSNWYNFHPRWSIGTVLFVLWCSLAFLEYTKPMVVILTLYIGKFSIQFTFLLVHSCFFIPGLICHEGKNRLTFHFWWMLRACVTQCENTGCVGERCFSCCEFSPDDSSVNGPCYMPVYLWWKQTNCRGNCRSHCIYAREKERAELGQGPVKYHGKWVSQSHYGVQVSCLVCLPLSVIA